MSDDELQDFLNDVDRSASVVLRFVVAFVVILCCVVLWGSR